MGFLSRIIHGEVPEVKVLTEAEVASPLASWFDYSCLRTVAITQGQEFPKYLAISEDMAQEIGQNETISHRPATLFYTD